VNEQPTLPGVPEPIKAALTYDYAVPRRFVEEVLGGKWLESWVPEADAMFAELGLTQDHVERLVMEYSRRVIFLFSPQTYTFRQRLGIAWYFLFGRHVTPGDNHGG
jgi:hypothetical protein